MEQKTLVLIDYDKATVNSPKGSGTSTVDEAFPLGCYLSVDNLNRQKKDGNLSNLAFSA